MQGDGIPNIGSRRFICPHCDILNDQLHDTVTSDVIPFCQEFSLSMCAGCQQHMVWRKDVPIYPVIAHYAMVLTPDQARRVPDIIVADLREAAQIFALSPRSSFALLQIALHKLCVLLGGTGQDISADLHLLAATAQIPSSIPIVLVAQGQMGQWMHTPGHISLDDNTEPIRSLALLLFHELSAIIETLPTTTI